MTETIVLPGDGEAAGQLLKLFADVVDHCGVAPEYLGRGRLSDGRPLYTNSTPSDPLWAFFRPTPPLKVAVVWYLAPKAYLFPQDRPQILAALRGEPYMTSSYGTPQLAFGPIETLVQIWAPGWVPKISRERLYRFLTDPQG